MKPSAETQAKIELYESYIVQMKALMAKGIKLPNNAGYAFEPADLDELNRLKNIIDSI
jgi:hypothetical protein